MRTHREGDVACIPGSCPAGGSSSVKVYHGIQKVAFTVHPTENGSHSRSEHVSESTWMMDTSSQVYSGPEDLSMDPHETLTETSSLSFVDAHTVDESTENHSLHGGVTTVYLKEFVLIDDDDDGDMSLREKTVTDLSLMDGRAADLVGGRLSSMSSSSVSDCQEESAAPEAAETTTKIAPDTRRCCYCTLS